MAKTKEELKNKLDQLKSLCEQLERQSESNLGIVNGITDSLSAPGAVQKNGLNIEDPLPLTIQITKLIDDIATMQQHAQLGGETSDSETEIGQ